MMYVTKRRVLLALALVTTLATMGQGCSGGSAPVPETPQTAPATTPESSEVEAVAEKAPKKLNVLHIISDDLFSDLGCYGDPVVKTPNIDRLADRGVRFDRAYCQYPLCNASRASFMTGLRPDTTQAFKNRTHFREAVPDVVTIPQSFKKAGYFVARVGKIYHYGVPKEIGTDGMDDPQSWEEVVNPAGRDVDDYSLVKVVETNAEGRTVASDGKTLEDSGGTVSWLAADGTDEEQTDGLCANAAIKLLEDRAGDGQPFYLALGFFRPHTPYVAPKSYFERYPLESIVVPEIAPGNDDLFPEAALASRKPAETAMETDLRKRAIQAYYASTTYMDAQVGRVVDALERLGLAENTIVIFHSDHGYHLGEKNLWKKQSLFEESARVPLIIALPGNGANGATSPRTVELLSLHKTLVELCGIGANPMTEGISLAPLLENPDASWSHPAFSQVLRFNRKDPEEPSFMGRSVRTERWRYTEWGGGVEGVELYDHDTDPKEMKNLATDPAQQEIVEQLRSFLAEPELGT